MSVKKIEGFTVFLKEKLGEGSFGIVYRALDEEHEEVCAVKAIKKADIDSDPYMKNALLSEIKVMRTIHSENCVRCIDVLQSSNNYYVIQQLCDSDLNKLMKSKPGRVVEEKEAVDILTQMCNGFLSLVKEGIVHRDLKPQNILLSKGKVKLGDFGFAKKCQEYANGQAVLNSIVGTPLYMSKQILQHESYTSKCDIWGIGFIFYEMLHGKTPWTGKNPFGLLQNIKNKPLQMSQELSYETKDFLKQALGVKECDRISWDQLFRHKIFNGYFEKKIKQNEILENKYKKIMSDINFYVTAQNIDIQKLWASLGYGENKTLNQKQFYEFLNIITPNINVVEEKYFFDEMDDNKDKQISLTEIQEQFKKYGITLNSSKKGIPVQNLTPEMEAKIVNCFNRLYFILTKKQLTLNKVFDVFDKDKSGFLEYEQFIKIINKLDDKFEDEELRLVFNLVDADNSKTIDFDELNNFYCKINGISTKLYKKKIKNPEQ